MNAPQNIETSPTRRDYALLLGLTALALTLRLAGLSHESIWFDEAVSVKLARADALDLATGQAGDTGNPMGYFLLLHYWLRLLGDATIENARALSALAGALSVPAIWLLARACGLSRVVGMLAAFLVAVSPPLVYLSQEARVFALFATVATLAAAAAARAERGGGILAWVGFAIAGAVLVYLHYYAAFVLLALGLHLLVWAWRYDRRGIIKLGACTAFVVLAFVPLLPTFLFQLSLGAARSGDTWWQHLALLPLFSTAGRTLVWKEAGVKMVAVIDLAVAALIFVPLGVLLWRARSRSSLLLAFVGGVLALAVLVSVTLAPMIHSHYLACILPGLMLLIAQALQAGWQSRSKAWTYLPAAGLVVIFAAALIRMYAVPHKTDWRSVAALVGDHAGELRVYFYDEYGADPFHYYRPDQPGYPVTEAFGNNGDGWGTVCYKMNKERAGFWLVWYPTSPTTLAEEPAIERWLAQQFLVEEEAKIPPMRLWRCRPR